MTRKEVEELYEGAILLEGFDDCIVGVTEEFGNGVRILYSRDKILESLQKDMTIESKSKITLKVGDNASITITDGQIEIKATTIKLTATGELSANGHPLKINGGGPTSTPTQWP